jgi:acyl carrier protein
MLKSQFLRLFEEMIEANPGTLTGAEELRQVKGWDSLAAVQFVALVDEHLQFTLDASQLDSCRTINDLIALAGDRITQ